MNRRVTRSRRAFVDDVQENFDQEASVIDPVIQQVDPSSEVSSGTTGSPVSDHGSHGIPVSSRRSSPTGPSVQDLDTQREQTSGKQSSPSSYGSEDSLLELRQMERSSVDETQLQVVNPEAERVRRWCAQDPGKSSTGSIQQMWIVW